jgi:hypothetical protein
MTIVFKGINLNVAKISIFYNNMRFKILCSKKKELGIIYMPRIKYAGNIYPAHTEITYLLLGYFLYLALMDFRYDLAN